MDPLLPDKFKILSDKKQLEDKIAFKIQDKAKQAFADYLNQKLDPKSVMKIEAGLKELNESFLSNGSYLILKSGSDALDLKISSPDGNFVLKPGETFHYPPQPPKIEGHFKKEHTQVDDNYLMGLIHQSAAKEESNDFSEFKLYPDQIDSLLHSHSPIPSEPAPRAQQVDLRSAIAHAVRMFGGVDPKNVKGLIDAFIEKLTGERTKPPLKPLPPGRFVDVE